MKTMTSLDKEPPGRVPTIGLYMDDEDNRRALSLLMAQILNPIQRLVGFYDKLSSKGRDIRR